MALKVGHLARGHGQRGPPRAGRFFPHAVGKHVAAEHVEVVLLVPVAPPHAEGAVDGGYEEPGLQVLGVALPSGHVGVQACPIQPDDAVVLQVPESAVAVPVAGTGCPCCGSKRPPSLRRNSSGRPCSLSESVPPPASVGRSCSVPAPFPVPPGYPRRSPAPSPRSGMPPAPAPRIRCKPHSFLSFSSVVSPYYIIWEIRIPVPPTSFCFPGLPSICHEITRFFRRTDVPSEFIIQLCCFIT